MSIKPIDNNDDDWYNRFFDFGNGMRRRNIMLDWHRSLFGTDPFKVFDNMEREMDSIFGRLRTSNQCPKRGSKGILNF